VVGAIDYYNLNSIVLPAFDERGFKLFPPDEHVLDDLCRRYDLVDNEEMEARPPPPAPSPSSSSWRIVTTARPLPSTRPTGTGSSVPSARRA